MLINAASEKQARFLSMLDAVTVVRMVRDCKVRVGFFGLGVGAVEMSMVGRGLPAAVVSGLGISFGNVDRVFGFCR